MVVLAFIGGTFFGMLILGLLSNSRHNIDETQEDKK